LGRGWLEWMSPTTAENRGKRKNKRQNPRETLLSLGEMERERPMQ
jgi:hypothetical protein